MMVKTMFGLENVLAKELQQLGAQNVQTGNRIVHFVGDKGFMYKANLSLRTALKILKPIYSVSVRNEAELYQAFVDFPWENYMREDQTFAFDSVVYGSTFTNSMFVSQKVKDAIADQFRATVGIRPSVDLKTPDVRINVHIDRNQCTFSLDSSG
ncbi:MAG: THUMP domain-containing protein, partial [Flavobacteriaceae bacterium]